MKDPEGAAVTLRALKELNVQIAIDDFGTGYSSLSRLRELPIDCLKIDRSFMRGVGRDAGDQAIASAVIAMADSMELCVIGEGVETSSQLGFPAPETVSGGPGISSQPSTAAGAGRGLPAGACLTVGQARGAGGGRGVARRVGTPRKANGRQSPAVCLSQPPPRIRRPACAARTAPRHRRNCAGTGRERRFVAAWLDRIVVLPVGTRPVRGAMRA